MNLRCFQGSGAPFFQTKGAIWLKNENRIGYAATLAFGIAGSSMSVPIRALDNGLAFRRLPLALALAAGSR